MAAEARKSDRHKEIERKFAVTEGSVSPSFDGLSSVAGVDRLPTQHLEAVYFDTAEQALAAQKITLRRRTGGLDAGWHLKLPAGPDTRTEIRLPLGDDDGDGSSEATGEGVVPAALKDVVLAIVRGRPLEPVARIATTRVVDVLYGPARNALAEFCDDEVTASATDAEPQEWREWELELAEDVEPEAGAELLERLTNRLLDAGAAPAGHGSKLAKVLSDARGGGQPAEPAARSVDPVHRAVAEQVQELLVWDRAVRADAWDSVHQMRVTTRKIRSLLQDSEESFGVSDGDWILDELRQLAGILGVARDAEVLAERYERALDELPANLVRGPVRERLVDGAKRRYDVGLKRSLTAMRSTRYFRLLDRLDELVAAERPVTESGEAPAPVNVDTAYKKVRKAAKAAKAAATPEEHDEILHRIRKRAKRLRYTAAATGSGPVAERAKRIQTLLGDHQDSVVSRTHLLEQADAAQAAGDETFTYGLLYEREHDLATRATEQLDDALKQLKRAVRGTR
jgi:CHAD domain-containing protein